MRRWLCGALLSGAAMAVPAAPPQDTLRWVVQEVPPHFRFVEGRAPHSVADLGHGELEGFLRVLLARLPQFRHEFVEASTTRFEALSRSGQTLCSALHVRTPGRLEWLYFSHLYPPLESREIHVIVRPELLQRLARDAQDGRLTLAGLLKRPELKLLLARDRAFGPQIDPLLAGRTVPRLAAGAHAGHQLLDMLRAGRMDYTLEYPAVVDAYLERIGQPGALRALPLAEGFTTQLATVACSRTPQGRRQIEAIEAAVRELAAAPDRAAWVQAWRGGRQSPADARRLNGYMNERARGGPRIE